MLRLVPASIRRRPSVGPAHSKIQPPNGTRFQMSYDELPARDCQSDPANQPEAAAPPGGAQVRQILLTLGAQLDRLRQIQEDNDGQAMTLEERERAIAGREVALAETQRWIETSKHEIEELQQSLQTQRAEQEQRARLLERERDALEERQDAATTSQLDAKRRLEAEFALIDAERESLAAERSRIEAERQATQVPGAPSNDDSETALAELEEELTERARELARTSDALTERERVIERRETELEARADEAARTTPDPAVLDGLHAELETVCLERDAIRGEMDTVQARLAAVAAELESARERPGAAPAAGPHDLNEGSVAAELDSLRAENARCLQAALQAEAALDDAERAAAEAEDRVAELTRERDEVIAQARSRGEAAGPPVEDVPKADLREMAHRLATVAERLKRRQRRLRDLRQGLKSRKPRVPRPARPVAQPRSLDAMEKHADQVRKFELRRLELRDKAAELAQKERRLVRRWARPKAVITVGWLLFMAIVAAGASWLAADHYFPATIAASVTLDAKAVNRAGLTDEDLANWSRFHIEMLGDPALRENIARRMAERRVDEYAEATAVNRRLSKDLTTDASVPGELTLTLTGTRGSETKMFLDLLATTVAAESSKQQRNRAGGVWAAPHGERQGASRAEYASLNPTAVADERMKWAGIAFAGAYGLILVVVGLIYGRLMKVKREFDADGSLFLSTEDALGAKGSAT